jgi:hypothetical protein
MSQSELLALVTQTLTRLSIDHMITGSLASSLYGEPRATHDIDVVAQFDERHIAELLDAFPAPQFYLSEQSIRDALEPPGMFNILDMDSGVKIDIWKLTTDAFDQSRFKRRRNESIDEHDVTFSSPEDIILVKLVWAKLSGGSEKQLTDALRVYETQYESLDHTYLGRWVERLNVDEQWQHLLREAEPLRDDEL